MCAKNLYICTLNISIGKNAVSKIYINLWPLHDAAKKGFLYS